MDGTSLDSSLIPSFLPLDLASSVSCTDPPTSHASADFRNKLSFLCDQSNFVKSEVTETLARVFVALVCRSDGAMG